MKWLEPRARFADSRASDGIPIIAVYPDGENALDCLPGEAASFARNSGWTPETRGPFAVRTPDGCLQALLFPLEEQPWPAAGPAFPFGSLPSLLGDRFPTGRDHPVHWRIEGLRSEGEREAAALGWLLGSYRFRPGKNVPSLACPKSVDPDRTAIIADAVCLARRLISTPANQLGPAALADAARGLASEHGAQFRCFEDGETVRRDWPLVQAVGGAAHEAPRVAEIRWGDPQHPSLAVVGKGITFDTGGVNLKPAAGMRLMKKDMGGAATALALAHMVMATGLPVFLRVLIPIAENAVSSAAFRPGDVFTSRSGLTVEIGNTDAEGRLILADALHAAVAEKPDLLVDFATLTGAARVALGQEVSPFYTDDDALAGELFDAGIACRDPLWRMPLWHPYDAGLKSEFADVSSTGTIRGAGSITAALFLRRFVPDEIRWAHVDLFAGNTASAPGKPVGGECQAARAFFEVLESRYAAPE